MNKYEDKQDYKIFNGNYAEIENRILINMFYKDYEDNSKEYNKTKMYSYKNLSRRAAVLATRAKKKYSELVRCKK